MCSKLLHDKLEMKTKRSFDSFPPAGRVDSVVIDSDVTNYTLSSLFPATEYEISLNAVSGSQESKMVSASVFTGTGAGGQDVNRNKSLISLLACVRQSLNITFNIL